MTGQENKTNLPYLWNSLHFCHWAGFASIVTAVVSSVYLFTISLLCSWHTTEFRDNLFFPAWLIAVGRGKARKSSEKNTLKENGREGNGYISATLHPPSLPNTPVSHKTSFIVPFCISLQLKVFFSFGSIWNLFEKKYVILSPRASSQLFASSFLSNSLTILSTQQACFGLIFSLLLACSNLMLCGLEASVYCKILQNMDPVVPPHPKRKVDMLPFFFLCLICM